MIALKILFGPFVFVFYFSRFCSVPNNHEFQFGWISRQKATDVPNGDHISVVVCSSTVQTHLQTRLGKYHENEASTIDTKIFVTCFNTLRAMKRETKMNFETWFWWTMCPWIVMSGSYKTLWSERENMLMKSGTYDKKRPVWYSNLGREVSRSWCQLAPRAQKHLPPNSWKHIK